MTERDKILSRISAALAHKAKPGHGHPVPLNSTNQDSKVSVAMACLPAVPEAFEDRLELFKKNAADLKIDFKLLNGIDELPSHVHALSKAEGWTRIGTHRQELTDLVSEHLGLPVCRTDSAYSKAELETCSVGITGCDALVAQTGSVLVTAHSAGGRALSVLPPHHVVLSRRSQLLGDLPQAFELLKNRYAPNYPSFISFITGPSRTGDIERILVLGAHGPKKLTIFCV